MRTGGLRELLEKSPYASSRLEAASRNCHELDPLGMPLLSGDVWTSASCLESKRFGSRIHDLKRADFSTPNLPRARFKPATDDRGLGDLARSFVEGPSRTSLQLPPRLDIHDELRRGPCRLGTNETRASWCGGSRPLRQAEQVVLGNEGALGRELKIGLVWSSNRDTIDLVTSSHF